MERNLEGDVSHSAPDWRAAGQLSSVYCRLDMGQYKLVRGLLAHNLGEKVEEFQRPLMSHLQDPSIQVGTVIIMIEHLNSASHGSKRFTGSIQHDVYK